ncbi:hypothetical protein FRAAL0851 [Frankia alni ACN14a]|uniref:Uncharacterized protein n=2 Tax=Frankiaceae TaxID=74712 RepID=Q0RSE4_FRAAA|nr:hypothetical protein FRAAL0851 [Frankia alni ACN14a]
MLPRLLPRLRPRRAAVGAEPKKQTVHVPVRRLDLTLEFDEERAAWDLVVGDGRAGPAGLAAARLLPDVVASADAGTSPRLLWISVELPGGDPDAAPSHGALRLVGRLFGAQTARLICRRPPAGAEPSAVVCAVSSVLAAQWRAGRLCLLLSSMPVMVDAPWRPLEAALLAASVGLGECSAGLGAQARSSVRAWGEGDLLDGVPHRSRPRAVRRLAQLADLLDAERKRAGEVHGASTRVASDRGDGEDGDGPSGLRAPGPAAASNGRLGMADPVERYLVDLDQRLVDPDVVQWRQGAKIAWSRQRGILEVRVRVVTGADVTGHWARAHEDVPNALPRVRHLGAFAPEPDTAAAGGVARLLVPPAVPAHRLRLDVTDRPLQRVVSSTSQARFEALAAGRRAGSHERRREWELAAKAWMRCDDGWMDADRPDMAALARRRAAACWRTLGEHAVAAATDRSAYEQAERLEKPWIFEHLGRLEPEPMEFDAELLDADDRW